MKTLVIRFWPHCGFSVQWSFDCWFWKLPKDLRENVMKDQYDNPVPDDLIVLDHRLIEEAPDSLKAIEALDWYESAIPARVGKPVLVSEAALTKVLPDDLVWDYYEPGDFHIDLSKGVNLIAHCLKRWDERMGFYHA